jgi:hypothetical protein
MSDHLRFVGAAPAVRLSRIDDYLVDNIYSRILSRMIDGVQEESDWAAKQIPALGHGERGSCGHGKTLRRLWKEYVEPPVSAQRLVRPKNGREPGEPGSLWRRFKLRLATLSQRPSVVVFVASGESFIELAFSVFIGAT